MGDLKKPRLTTHLDLFGTHQIWSRQIAWTVIPHDTIHAILARSLVVVGASFEFEPATFRSLVQQAITALPRQVSSLWKHFAWIKLVIWVLMRDVNKTRVWIIHIHADVGSAPLPCSDVVSVDVNVVSTQGINPSTKPYCTRPAPWHCTVKEKRIHYQRDTREELLQCLAIIFYHGLKSVKECSNYSNTLFWWDKQNITNLGQPHFWGNTQVYS